MADMPTDFWGGWIAVITLISLVGLGWLVYGVYFSANDGGEAESTVWDETLREGANPAPMWWFWLVFALMIVSVIYLMLYPGLGTYSGALQWSQGGRLEQSFALYRNEFDGRRAEILRTPMEDLRDDALAMASARRVFDQNCAACHGPDGRGQMAYFPDLTDDDWQWGREAGQIEQSVRAGRQAVMPGLAAALGEGGVEEVARFVSALAGGMAIPAGDPGQALFATYCAACHGADGTGNILLGGSDLTDDIWLYGGTEDALVDTVASGRQGMMPAFEDRLDDTQIRLLVAWLSRGSAQ